MTETVDIANSALIKLGNRTISSLSDSVKAAEILNAQFETVRDRVFRGHPWNCLLRRVKLRMDIVDLAGAQATDPVAISAPGHTFSSGWHIRIDDVGGMTELNGNTYMVYGPEEGAFWLHDEDGNDIDGSAFGAYTSGGTATRVPIFGYDCLYETPSDFLRALWVTNRLGTENYHARVERNVILTDAPECWLLYIRTLEDPDDWDPLLREVLAVELGIDVSYNLTGSKTLAAYLRKTFADTLSEARSVDSQEGRQTATNDDEWINVR